MFTVGRIVVVPVLQQCLVKFASDGLIKLVSFLSSNNVIVSQPHGHFFRSPIASIDEPDSILCLTSQKYIFEKNLSFALKIFI